LTQSNVASKVALKRLKKIESSSLSKEVIILVKCHQSLTFVPFFAAEEILLYLKKGPKNSLYFVHSHPFLPSLAFKDKTGLWELMVVDCGEEMMHCVKVKACVEEKRRKSSAAQGGSI